MPKIKTRKAFVKRFVITKNKKVLKRTAGKNHFNAREDGATGRSKKRDNQISKADRKNILVAITNFKKKK